MRPYQYPHYIKREIEKLITSLLQSSVVQPSASPYSSLVLMVEKKDGLWQLCVDYIALNRITIKDKFSTPIINNLLGEFNWVKVFLKLDIRSRYHQIRMHCPDIEKKGISHSPWAL